MLICAGDLVKRRERPGRAPAWNLGMHLSASDLFYDGYYLVIDVMEADVPQSNYSNFRKVKKVSVCKIMDCNGRLNWIDIRNLIKIT